MQPGASAELGPRSPLWSMGVNQSHAGTDKNGAILNLHLATGQIGRPGAGPFSLTGQPNAMGGRETGGLSHLLPGYRRVTDAAERADVERHWGLAPGTLREQPGLSALEMFERAAAGEVRALWIMATNPAASMPDLDLVDKALRQTELVIVQDAYHPTETSRFADVALPAAQWPEKDGVMTNSERCLTYLPKLVDPPGEAWPDAVIVARVAAEMGFKHAFAYGDTGEIFAEFAALTAGRPATTPACLMRASPAAGRSSGRCPRTITRARRASTTDGRFPTADGSRPVQLPWSLTIRSSRPTDIFPLSLTTGRVRDHWHTLTRTANARALMARNPGSPILEVHPSDARRAGLSDGRLRRDHLAPRQGRRSVPGRPHDPRGDVLPAVSLGPPFSASTRRPTT